MNGKLTPFFEPKSVAIIRASSIPGKSGRTVIRNILANGYAGKVSLINPKGGLGGWDDIRFLNLLCRNCGEIQKMVTCEDGERGRRFIGRP